MTFPRIPLPPMPSGDVERDELNAKSYLAAIADKRPPAKRGNDDVELLGLALLFGMLL